MNLTFEFISKMYNNRNSYAEVFSKDELKILHVSSSLEDSIKEFIKKKKIILLTGNPGDGKTHIIRILDSYLKKYDAFVELDINEVEDYTEFLARLKYSIEQDNPVLIAVNEYPLYELLKFMPEDFPYKQQILRVKEQSVIYGDECLDYDSQKVVIIDLNNRNLLEKNHLEKSFAKVLDNVSLCNFCGIDTMCSHNSTLNRLQNPVIQTRIINLMSLLGEIGVHVVMRDILGFIAFLLTEGKSCKDIEFEYHDRLFEGNNSLFRYLKKLDPANLSHPIIDEKLWNGYIQSGWLYECPSIIPGDLTDPEEAMQAFTSAKRKYFFEHTDGYQLINLYPEDLTDFLKLIKEASDDETDVIQKIILSINKFYNPTEIENQKLFIWNTHSYESRKYPETIISNRSIPFQNMDILVPKVPRILKNLCYTPDHFVLRIKPNPNNKDYIDLKINYDLFRMLTLIADGFPPQILPSSHKFTIERFMFNLSAFTKKYQTNEFIIRNIKQNNTNKIIIKDGKYLIKSR